MFGPVGCEADLRDVSIVHPERCDLFGALREFTVNQHHLQRAGGGSAVASDLACPSIGAGRLLA